MWDEVLNCFFGNYLLLKLWNTRKVIDLNKMRVVTVVFTLLLLCCGTDASSNRRHLRHDKDSRRHSWGGHRHHNSQHSKADQKLKVGLKDSRNFLAGEIQSDQGIQSGDGQNTPDSRGPRRFPTFFNLATRAEVSVNATCGDGGAETFCKLVEHVHSRLPEQIQCGVCDQSDPERNHPITNAVDGSHGWWQSPSIANGKEYNYVTITFDLRQTYQVAYVIVKAANSPRPGNWILERSLDGVTYTPWQYFAMSASECQRLYGVEATWGIPSISRDDQVLCRTAFSRLQPVENGEIHVSLVNGRPGEDQPSQLLKEFTTARFVRLRFQRIQTLLADLMTFVYNDPKDLDPSVTNRYYYSIKDISIGGQCICRGSSLDCIMDPRTGESRCECTGNTCGRECDQCCPLYNHQPWPQGDDGVGDVLCEECQCFGHAEACVYNTSVADMRLSLNVYGEYDGGGGVCLDCQHHTMGLNCEICTDGFYRPSGVDPYDPYSCVQCDCRYVGTTGQCVKDDSRVHEGKYPGDCLCAEGYEGVHCEVCAPGYTGYPYCEPCPCSSAGSLNPDICLGECVCKPHVCGDDCNKCLPGYFNLQPTNPLGCDQCFCFGITQDCSSSTIPSQCLTSLEDWLVTDYVGSGSIHPVTSADESLVITTQQAKEAGLNRALYWTAPSEYIGNKVTSYGGVLEFMFSYSVDAAAEEEDDEEGYLANLDLILEGNGLLLGHSGVYYVEDDIHHIAMNLTERGWTHRGHTSIPTDTPASKEELLTVLADVKRLLIRAGHHVHQAESRLHGVSMEVSSPTGSAPPLPGVEMCACPQGYHGTSCELCAPGYRRVGNILVGGTCEPCDCHGHADVCDPYSGECMNCEHHTTGPQCEQCTPGYTGDPTDGHTDSCLPCTCPLNLPSNNFASSCSLRQDGLLQCECHRGYEGNSCERCSEGYYGNPLQPGDYCKPCNCHGNSIPGSDCDTSTGECRNCQGNTEGLFCDKCMDGYYGSAVNGDCQACECHVYGSVNNSCDSVSGQCECRPLYTGTDCAQCQEGYGNILSGCEVCDCDPVGSVSVLCDPVTGDCTCKPGVGGDSCDTCLPGYYEYSDEGCKACACSDLGSNHTECDQTSGQCACKEGVTGRMCDFCQENHWGLGVGGCEPCGCDLNGAVTSQCELQSGQCECKMGVSGEKCDHCLPGYHGFSWEGCQECPVCPLAGQVCDPVTGECSCPPNTAEPLCDKCTPGTWGYDPQLGCKPCLCDLEGSEAFNCDLQRGQCLCRDLYTSQKCDQCVHGHYAFPDCLACECSVEGSVSHTCIEQGLCLCDDGGQCTCKEFVNGSRCDLCEPGTFALEESNPRGCTECFCSGRTDDCLQAPYTWSLVDIPDEDVTLTNDTDDSTARSIYPNSQQLLVVQGNGSSVLVDERHAHLPLYWSLPKQYLGDWTLSYNGELRVTVAGPSPADVEEEVSSSDPDPLSTPLPIMSLLGNHVLRLHYVPTVGEFAEASAGGRYTVKFREDVWQRASGRKVSRAELMTALQNVQTVLIRLSTNSRQPGTYSVQRLVREQAVPAGGAGLQDAVGVEICLCPPGYTGLSCQDPAPGFYRVRPVTENVTLHLPNMEDLIGYAQPCVCNAHTDQCDPDTGHCLNCSHNTEGDHCQFCEAGYYGDPTDGSLDSCVQCACPVVREGQIPTCHSEDASLSGFVCDECPKGFTGDACEECVPGYYGDAIVGCFRCECNPQGSQSSVCDVTTGQCSCHAGILGRTCDRCAERHAVRGGRCIPCHTGCTGILFDEIDRVESQMLSINVSVEHLLPWQQLSEMGEEAGQMMRVGSVRVPLDPSLLEALTRNVSEMERLGQRLEDTWDLVVRRVSKAHGEDREAKTDATKLAEEIMGELGDVQSYTENALSDILNRLESEELDLDSTLELAEEQLAAILQGNFTMKAIEVDRDRRLAASLLEKVQMYRQDHTLDLNSTSRGVSQVEEKLADLLQHTSSASNVTDKAQLYNHRNKEEFQGITNVTDSITAEKTSVLDTHSDGDEMNKEATEILENSTLHFEEIHDSSNKLFLNVGGLMFQLSPLEGVLDELEASVDSAANHSERLSQQASGLDELFNDTRATASDPLMAVQAFHNMAEAIEAAETAAQRATDTASNASLVVLNTENGSLAEQAALSRNRSEQVAARSTEQKDTLEQSLSPRLERYMQAVDGIQAANQLTEKRVSEMQAKLTNMTGESREKLDAVRNQSEWTDGESAAVAGRVEAVREGIDSSLRPRLEEMRDFQLDGLIRANASVNAAREVHREVENSTSHLHERVESIQQLGNNIAYELAQLRENIRLAREQANSLRVSLYNPDSCFRRYRPKLKSGTTNSIHMHIKSNSTKQDMLLFLMSTPGTPDFLALELVGGRVRFSWNTGAEDASVDHPLSVEGGEEGAWYEIKAQRVAHLGMLSVKRLSSEFPAPTVDGKSSSPTHTKLDVSAHTHVFIGGAPQSFPVPGFISSKSFSGCVGDVYLDGKPVGLYNFHELDGSGCEGCKPVPDATDGQVGPYQFDGTGYASRDQVPYTTRFYSVLFKMKVIFEEALLFFTHNPHTGDYLAIEMTGGRVQLTFSVQGVSVGRLVTVSTYNTNTWVRVDGRVMGLEAVLHVDQETVEGFALDLGVSAMDLEDTQIYFGGAPTTVKGYLHLYNITSLSFLGCMNDVQVLSKGPYKLNLMEGLYVGMQSGCQTQKARVVGLNGTGHLELPSHDLQRDAEVTFSFRTQEEEGLILLSLGQDPSHFYSLSLVGGQIVAWFNGGGGLRTIESPSLYNDGDYHSVSIIKSNRLLELYVDDEQVGSSRLPSGDSRINTMRGEDGGLYIGGVPRGVGAEGSAATLQPFRGCISDIIITERLLTLDEPLTYHKADVGRCNAVALFDNITGNGDSKPNPGIPSFTVTVKRPKRTTTTPEPTTEAPDPTACAAEGFFTRYQDSVAFGDVKNSHAKVKVEKRSLKKDFDISLEFRTFRPNGLMVYITNSNQTEYVAMALLAGRLVVSYKGRNMENQANSSQIVSDGSWHRVYLTKKERAITVQLNEDQPIIRSINRKINVADPVYVGGLPIQVNPPQGMVSESFKGCVRDFVLNEQVVDFSELEAVMGTRRCYKHVELGAYFDGFGYAIYDEKYEIASEFVLELDMRTRERDGVILSIGDNVGKPALTVEMYQGQLQITAVNDGGRFTARSEKCNFCLCDNQWHHVKAELIKNVVMIEVDGEATVGVSEGFERFLNTQSSLYIGGYPVFAPYQAASSSDTKFVGCMKNLRINDTDVNWHSVHNLLDVQISGCPISLT